jgi:hypothetical protein
MTSQETLHACYEWHRNEATKLAGRLTDLAQRAAVYHHIYEASGGNHVFPLIAAHGALWAGGYFRFGMQLGEWLSLPSAFRPARRKARLVGLAAFADAFREINRSVCIDTYTTFHFTAEHGEHPDAASFVPVAKLDVLNRMHHAHRLGLKLSSAEKLAAFEAFFRSEQATVVGPRVATALEAFDWPLMKFLALKPLIRFAYFPLGDRLWFRDFSNADERIANGLRAFGIAERVGFANVERRLRDYGILPSQFWAGTARHFESIRAEVAIEPVAC